MIAQETVSNNIYLLTSKKLVCDVWDVCFTLMVSFRHFKPIEFYLIEIIIFDRKVRDDPDPKSETQNPSLRSNSFCGVFTNTNLVMSV